MARLLRAAMAVPANRRRRRFDAVVVYRYDRSARSLRHLVSALGDFDALP